MSAFAKTVTPSAGTKLYCGGHVTYTLRAGESLAAGDACYIKGSDGLVYRSIGATLNDPSAKVDGFASLDALANMPVTLLFDVDMSYGPANATPGTRLFLSGSVAGGLDTAASTGGTGPIATVQYVTTNESINHAVIHVNKSNY